MAGLTDMYTPTQVALVPLAACVFVIARIWIREIVVNTSQAELAPYLFIDQQIGEDYVCWVG
jgi:hypothetical protein